MNPIKQLEARVGAVNSMLCVGLDADMTRLPERFLAKGQPQFAFNRWVIEQTHEHVCAYKPNTAFYEARGTAGWAELAATTAYLRAHHPEIFLICDAKRGDIGNTNRGYATAIFDEMGFDAVTLHPYLGGAALKPFLEREDKASIILCRTSNPAAGEIQGLAIDGRPLWEHVAEHVCEHWNTRNNCMLVIGATHPDDLRRAREVAGEMTLLVPGVGAQGGDAARVREVGVNRAGRGLVVNASRSVIFAEDPGAAAGRLAATLGVT